MGIKGKHRRGKTRRGRTSRRRTSHNKSSRHYARSSRTYKKNVCMRGGNYEKDITTRTTEGVATKPLNKFVVTVPGYGTMSGSAYKNLMEDIDRNGKDIYD